MVNSNSTGGHSTSSGSVKNVGSSGTGQTAQVSGQIIPSQMGNNATSSSTTGSSVGNSGPSSYDRYDLDFKIASVKKVWDDSTPPSVSTPSSSTPSSIRHSSPSTQVATGQSQGLPVHSATSQFEGHTSGAFSHHSSMVGDENKLVNFSFSNEPIKSKSPRSTISFNHSSSSKAQLNAQPANVPGGMVVPSYGPAPLSTGEMLTRQIHKNAAMYQQQQQQQQAQPQMVRNNLPGSSPPVLLSQVNSPPPLDHTMRHHQPPLTAHNHYMSAAMGSNQVHHTNHAALPPFSTIYPAFPQQLQQFAQHVANSQLAAQQQHLFQQSQAVLHHQQQHQQQQQQQQHANVRNVPGPFGGGANAGDLSHDAYRMSTSNASGASAGGPTGAHGTPNSTVTPSVSAAAAAALAHQQQSIQQQHQHQLAAFFKQSFLTVQPNFNHAVHQLPHHLSQANAAGAHSYGAPGQTLTNPQTAGNQAPTPQGASAHAPGAIGSYFTANNSTHVPSPSMYHVPSHVTHHPPPPPPPQHQPHPHSQHPHPHAQFAPPTGSASNVTPPHATSNHVSSVTQQAQSQPQQQQQQPNQSVASSQAFRQPVSRNNRNRF